jgi:hypothetical protein
MVWIPFGVEGLVVIGNFNVVHVAVSPEEADAPLLIDADAVLTRAVAAEDFEVVAWRETKVFKFGCVIEIEEL